LGFSHVLITRPEAESAELAGLLAATGLEPVIVPAYRFVPGYPGFDLSTAWRAGNRRLAVFSSTRAVTFGLRQLPAGFLEGVQLAAIGPATANALAAAGNAVDVVPREGFTSEALLSHPELAREPGDAVIFAAPGGRAQLRQGLQDLGWAVRMAYVYRRVELEALPEAAAQLDSADGVVSAWTSAAAIGILSKRLPAAAWAKVCEGICVATSGRLGARLEAAGARQVRVAQGPGNKAIAACIGQLI
jgi:uroporphyrinogen-III synthase